MKRASLALGLALLFGLGGLAAGQDLGGALGIRLEPAQITVGDPALAELTLVWEGDEPTDLPRFPTWQRSWGKADVIAAGPVEAKSQGPRKVYTQKLRITAFEPGTLELPPITVTVPLAGHSAEVKSTSPARLLVASVLPGEKNAQGQELEAKGAAGLVGLRLSPWPFWSAVVVLSLFNVLAAWTIARAVGRQRPAAASGAADAALARLSPFEELIERLEQLAGVDGEKAHTGISFALRQFLSRTFDVQALESTTTEIQRLLRSLLPVGLSHEWVNLLKECDRVKFAGAGTGSNVDGAATAARLGQARDLGRQVVDRVRPATERPT